MKLLILLDLQPEAVLVFLPIQLVVESLGVGDEVFRLLWLRSLALRKFNNSGEREENNLTREN